MSDHRILLDAASFMDSRHAVMIESAPTAGVREVVQRFLRASYEGMAKAPRLLDGDELGELLTGVLPRYFARQDELAGCVDEVLRAYLDHLQEEEVVTHAFEQRHALESRLPELLQAIEEGRAQRDGTAVQKRQETVVHKVERTGRNDPCPCGSGKKFKKCCMRLADQ